MFKKEKLILLNSLTQCPATYTLSFNNINELHLGSYVEYKYGIDINMITQFTHPNGVLMPVGAYDVSSFDNHIIEGFYVKVKSSRLNGLDWLFCKLLSLKLGPFSIYMDYGFGSEEDRFTSIFIADEKDIPHVEKMLEDIDYMEKMSYFNNLPTKTLVPPAITSELMLNRCSNCNSNSSIIYNKINTSIIDVNGDIVSYKVCDDILLDSQEEGLEMGKICFNCNKDKPLSIGYSSGYTSYTSYSSGDCPFEECEDDI